MNHLEIEDHRRLRTWSRSFFEGVFTSAIWALWVYLFLPLFSAVMWAFGLSTFYTHVFKGVSILELFELLKRLGLAVILIYLALRGWGFYNLFFFGRRNRRKRTSVLTVDRLSRHYGVPAAEIVELQGQQEIVWEGLYEKMIAPASNRRCSFEAKSDDHQSVVGE